MAALVSALLIAEILWTGSLIAVGYFAAQAISDLAIALKFLPAVGLLILFFFLAVTNMRRALR